MEKQEVDKNNDMPGTSMSSHTSVFAPHSVCKPFLWVIASNWFCFLYLQNHHLGEMVYYWRQKHKHRAPNPTHKHSLRLSASRLVLQIHHVIGILFWYEVSRNQNQPWTPLELGTVLNFWPSCLYMQSPETKGKHLHAWFMCSWGSKRGLCAC